MSDNASPKSVTVGFNILLMIYLIYVSFVSCLFAPEANSHVAMDNFFEIAPGASIVAAVLLVAVYVFLGALVVGTFWNRLVAGLFSIRDINYQEALAIFLIASILLGT